jgi:hypothetical protein
MATLSPQMSQFLMPHNLRRDGRHALHRLLDECLAALACQSFLILKMTMMVGRAVENASVELKPQDPREAGLLVGGMIASAYGISPL